MRKSVGKDSPFPTDLRQNAQHDETRTKHGWRFPRKLRAKGPAENPIGKGRRQRTFPTCWCSRASATWRLREQAEKASRKFDEHQLTNSEGQNKRVRVEMSSRKNGIEKNREVVYCDGST